MKYILIALLSIYSTLSQAQVYKFKAFNTFMSVYDDNGNFVRREGEKTVDILVVLNFDKYKISTYGKKTGDIDLVSAPTQIEDKNQNTWINYDAVDGDGEKCLVQLVIFKDQSEEHKANLYIDYAKYKHALVFQLKKDE